MKSLKWIPLSESKPTEKGLYVVSWDEPSPSPCANLDDTVDCYGVYYWNGGAFFHESDRVKGITHWLDMEIPFRTIPHPTASTKE